MQYRASSIAIMTAPFVLQILLANCNIKCHVPPSSYCAMKSKPAHLLHSSAHRAWNIAKNGELSEAGAREKAHKDRITSIVWHKNFLYSVSYDGTVKMWDATNLELVMEIKKAHDGQRVQCGAVGPDGFLYTGGDDKVSTWQQHARQTISAQNLSFACCC